MKITKFVHACVLVEDDNHVALFDPGEFTNKSGLFDLARIPKLDFVLITHEHFDHYYQPLIEQILAAFPDVKFYTNSSVAGLLSDIGVKNISTQSDDIVTIKPLDHQSMSPLASLPMCNNVEIHYKGVISHPGDSHQLQSTSDVLFVPLAGPWGATIDGVRMADKLKPKFIVPIHDWMWNEEWRRTMYDRIENYFAAQNIKFLKPIDGQSIEVSL